MYSSCPSHYKWNYCPEKTSWTKHRCFRSFETVHLKKSLVGCWATHLKTMSQIGLYPQTSKDKHPKTLWNHQLNKRSIYPPSVLSWICFQRLDKVKTVFFVQSGLSSASSVFCMIAIYNRIFPSPAFTQFFGPLSKKRPTPFGFQKTPSFPRLAKRTRT